MLEKLFKFHNNLVDNFADLAKWIISVCHFLAIFIIIPVVILSTVGISFRYFVETNLLKGFGFLFLSIFLFYTALGMGKCFPEEKRRE